MSDLENQLADLDARIAALDADRRPVREQLGNLDRTYAKLIRQRGDVKSRLEQQSEKPRVSDHAVIRYLERTYGFDFDDVRQSLLTPVVVDAMKVGAAAVNIDGGSLKLRGKTVVTFIGNGENAGNTPKAKRRKVLA